VTVKLVQSGHGDCNDSCIPRVVQGLRSVRVHANQRIEPDLADQSTDAHCAVESISQSNVVDCRDVDVGSIDLLATGGACVLCTFNQ